MIYSQKTLTMEEVEVALKLKELKKRVSKNKIKNSQESLVARGSTNKRGSGAGGNKGRSRSKSKSRKQKCFQCHKEGVFEKIVCNVKEKEKRNFLILERQL